MRGQRLREGIKRARRVLRAWDARQNGVRRERNGNLYKPGGFMEQMIRFTRVPSRRRCGNQRRYEGPTLQEQRAQTEFEAELAAWEQVSDEDWKELDL